MTIEHYLKIIFSLLIVLVILWLLYNYLNKLETNYSKSYELIFRIKGTIFKYIGNIIKYILRKVKNKNDIHWQLLFLLAFLLVCFYLYFRGYLEKADLISVLVSFGVAIVIILSFMIKSKQKLSLISFTASYILKEDTNIDELLGYLSSGMLDRLKIDPLDEFFNSVLH